MVHDPEFALIDPCVFWDIGWLLKTLHLTIFASFRYLLDSIYRDAVDSHLDT